MVRGDAVDTTPFPHEPETRHQDRCRNLGVENASQGSGVSLLNLGYRLRVGIESADQHLPVFFCARRKV